MADLLKYIQEKVIFLPRILHRNFEFKFDQKFEEIFIETPFDGNINMLHFKVNDPKGIIVYFHGNADNLHRWGRIAGKLTDFGYDVLVMDYRGFGKSTGFRDEKNMHSDAQFCYDYAKNIFDEKNIIVYGRSLGGAFAVKITVENQPRTLILESAFYNLQDLVNRWLPKKITNRLSSGMPYHFHSDEYILNVKTPVYHFHGSKDLVVPLNSGKKLYDVFDSSQPEIEKKFIEIKKGKHNNLSVFQEYRSELKKILD